MREFQLIPGMGIELRDFHPESAKVVDQQDRPEMPNLKSIRSVGRMPRMGSLSKHDIVEARRENE